MGLLENVLIKSCGIKFEHTFAIVDFGQDPSYEVILGRPFMRQMMALEDWGYDYLYLRHKDVTTRINLKDHTFRDVTHTPVEEFESATSDLTPHTHTDSTSEKDVWICQTPTPELLDEDERMMDKITKQGEYIPIPFLEDDIDPYEWLHTLSTIDVCALPPQTQFCDERGYEIMPVRVITVVDEKRVDSNWPKELLALNIGPDDVSLVDVSTSDSEYDYLGIDSAGYINESSDSREIDEIEPEEQREKIQILLRGHESILLEETLQELSAKRKDQRNERKKKQARSKGRKRPPKIESKNEYFYHVGALDSIKAQNKGILLGLINQKEQPKCREKKTTKSVTSSKETKEDMPDTKTNKEKKTKPTKLERKAFYEDCKRTLNKTWQSISDESSETDEVDVPSNFKSYTIQDRKIMLQQPKRVKPEQLGELYDGPEDAKKVDLANPGEEPRPVYIATDLTQDKETLLIATLKEYKDVFA